MPFNSYPKWYVEHAEEAKVSIAQLENSRDPEIARRIYS